MKYEGKIKTQLSNSKWFHATTYIRWENIKNNGIIADFNKYASDALDFGYGFYLTNKSDSAERLINGWKRAGLLNETEVLTIIEFDFSPLEWFEDDIHKELVLNKHDDEFALFVYENRMYNINGNRQQDEKEQNYDIIYGVQTDAADKAPNETAAWAILEHKMGNLTKDEVLQRLKRSYSMKQLCLTKQELCDVIKPSRVYTFEKNENNETIILSERVL
jgi:hypothetical protein